MSNELEQELGSSPTSNELQLSKQLAVATDTASQIQALFTSSQGIATRLQELHQNATGQVSTIESALSNCTRVNEQSAAITATKESAAGELRELESRNEEALGLLGTIKAHASSASEHTSALERHVAVAAEADQRVEEYELQLQRLLKSCQKQLTTIEGLLPGATSAGLASAFDGRSKSFKEPEKNWHKWFIGSVLALILLALQGLWAASSADTPSYDEVILLWLTRLPIAVALVWLALHASREAALAKRIEEDYGYKAAISTSLEGFQKMLREINNEANESSVLGRLCSDTLTTIASPPGRIYDKHRLTETPIDKIRDTVTDISNALPKPLSGKESSKTS